MSDILSTLEKEAKNFMDKGIKLEANVVKNIQSEVKATRVNIERYLKSLHNVNLNYVTSILRPNIYSIIKTHMENEIQILDNAITNSFDAGFQQADKFLSITNAEFENVINTEESKKKALLAALLLFGKKLIQGLNDDLLNKLEKDIISIYIVSKNKSDDAINNLDRGTQDNVTINTVLSGEDISKYISPTFDNINRRADTISKSEIIRALNHALLLRYISAKDQNQQLKVKWVEINDLRLCKHCKAAANGGSDGDGVYDINGITPPPLHPNCRCVLIPFLYTWFTL